MISIADFMAWDFQSATSPLQSKQGQSETWVLGGTASVSEATGVLCDAVAERMQLNCTNGGDLINWAFPYSYVIVCKRLGLGVTADTDLLYRRQSGGTDRRISIGFNPGLENNSNGLVYYLATDAAYIDSSSFDVGVETVLLFEMRANGHTLYVNGTSVSNNTGSSLTIPSTPDTDFLRVGNPGGENMNTEFYGIALVPGALTSDDRTELFSDWRGALGLSGSTGPGFRSYYLNA